MKRYLMFLLVVLPLSLLILPPVGHTAPTPKETAFAAIDRNKDEIVKVGDAIYSFAELGHARGV